MNVQQVYEQTIRPLTDREKLTIARLIIEELDSTAVPPDSGYEHLSKILPNIERITLSEHDLASVLAPHKAG